MFISVFFLDGLYVVSTHYEGQQEREVFTQKTDSSTYSVKKVRVIIVKNRKRQGFYLYQISASIVIHIILVIIVKIMTHI